MRRLFVFSPAGIVELQAAEVIEVVVEGGTDFTYTLLDSSSKRIGMLAHISGWVFAEAMPDPPNNRG